jgi:hypothetical protein
MALFPPSTNHQFQGPAIAAWFVVLAGIVTIVPGCIHYFLPDGGAGIIAGMDLSQRGETIIAVFAWMGAQQIAQGIGYVVIGLRYRSLVPLVLLLILIERGLSAYDGWFGKGAVSGHHPPEHYGSVVGVALAIGLLALVLTQTRRSTSA